MNDDWINNPKIFVDNFRIATAEEFWLLCLSSGSGEEGDDYVFTMSPQHAKRMQKYITHQLELYEKKFGPIKADWKPDIISPFMPRSDNTEPPEFKKPPRGSKPLT